MDRLNRSRLFYLLSDGRVPEFLEELRFEKDANHRDGNGMTLLHFASYYRQSIAAQAIIDCGADLEIRDSHGNTPMWHAVMQARGNYGAVKVLIEAGAEVDTINHAGRSPRTIAETFKDEELLRVLNGS